MKFRVYNAFRLRPLLHQLSYVDLAIYGGTRTHDPRFIGLRVCAVRPELQLQESDLNRRPPGYEPSDLPG